MMRRRRIISVSLAAVCLIAGGVAPRGECATKKASTDAAAAPVSRDAAIRAQLDALKNGVSTGNAKAMAGLWTEDGRYVDDDGNEYVGRTALEKNFGALFAQNGKAQVEISMEKVRFPASNVGLVEGVVKRSMGGNTTAIPVSRYSMVFEQRGGQWQIASAVETPVVSGGPAAVSGLQKLGWLIGDWTAKRDNEEVRMKAEWVPSKRFITCRYQIQKPGAPERQEMQVIGWDSRSGTPISWHFDSAGGFGEGNWSRTGGQWVISARGVDGRGDDMSMINMISQSGPDGFIWQSVNRRVNGTLVEDTQPVKVERVGTSTANK
jgi:uncharacterized protein (TIGR02246 family)